MPSRRRCAASISRSVGTVAVFKLEHLQHDLPHGREGVELAALYLVKQSRELRIACNSLLQMLLRARRGDGEDLARQVAAAALLEPAAGFEKGAVLLERLPELGHVLGADGLGEDDRRRPRAAASPAASPPQARRDGPACPSSG